MSAANGTIARIAVRSPYSSATAATARPPKNPPSRKM